METGPAKKWRPDGWDIFFAVTLQWWWFLFRPLWRRTDAFRDPIWSWAIFVPSLGTVIALFVIVPLFNDWPMGWGVPVRDALGTGLLLAFSIPSFLVAVGVRPN